MNNPIGRSRVRLVLLSSALVLAACGDATRPDAGGRYTATLAAPAGHVNGAAVVVLTGEGIDSVTAVTGRVFAQRLQGRYVRVVVVNEQPGALAFAVHIARGGDMPTANILEVADGEDELRPTLAGYAVRFAR